MTPLQETVYGELDPDEGRTAFQIAVTVGLKVESVRNALVRLSWSSKAQYTVGAPNDVAIWTRPS